MEVIDCQGEKSTMSSVLERRSWYTVRVLNIKWCDLLRFTMSILFQDITISMKTYKHSSMSVEISCLKKLL